MDRPGLVESYHPLTERRFALGVSLSVAEGHFDACGEQRLRLQTRINSVLGRVHRGHEARHERLPEQPLVAAFGPVASEAGWMATAVNTVGAVRNVNAQIQSDG